VGWSLLTNPAAHEGGRVSLFTVKRSGSSESIKITETQEFRSSACKVPSREVEMMDPDKLNELKDQLDLTIKMVEQRRMQKYDGNWDAVLRDYKKLRGFLDDDIQKVRRLKSYETGVIGMVRNAFDLLLYNDYNDPLLKEMGKVENLVKELFSNN
jgi:hypothetical protein